jgi:hypothetical protein
VQSKKTVSENSAVQIGAQFALDEASHGCTVAPGSGEEGLELLPDDFVQERLLGLVAFVLDGQGSAGTGAKRRGERPEDCLLEGVQASGVPACTGPRASHREWIASIAGYLKECSLETGAKSFLIERPPSSVRAFC